MSMKIAKDNGGADFYSENGAGDDPIRANVTLDGSGAPAQVTAATVSPL